TARICSEHFTDDDYCLKEKLLNLPYYNKWKLKPDAIPSLNLIKHCNLDTKRNKRVERRGLIKIIHEHKQLNSKKNYEDIPAPREEITSEPQPEKNINIATQTERSDDLEKLNILKEELEDVAFAISLYAGGPCSYRLLRKRSYPLPGVSTIRRWAVKIDVRPVEKDNAAIFANELSELQCDGLENLVGFIAFKLKGKEKLGYIPNTYETSFSWIDHLTEGGLMKPADDFLMKCKHEAKIVKQQEKQAMKKHLPFHQISETEPTPSTSKEVEVSESEEWNAASTMFGDASSSFSVAVNPSVSEFELQSSSSQIQLQGWIQVAEHDNLYAKCSACVVNLKAKYSDLIKHANSNKHKNAVKKNEELKTSRSDVKTQLRQRSGTH
ncbi:hypothetical protein NQ314_011786, partial [Rhamnusium bicolor]